MSNCSTPNLSGPSPAVSSPGGGNEYLRGGLEFDSGKFRGYFQRHEFFSLTKLGPEREPVLLPEQFRQLMQVGSEGERMKKSSGTVYWFGVGSDALDETDLSGNLTNEYMFFGGKRIARRDSGNNISYYFEDHLGTSRVITNASGSPCYDADFYPFGGERTAYTNTCPQNYKFTGKERDTESGLDYFGARYYGSGMGRFTGPDPKMIAVRHLLNPQKLNKYVYVLNNPLAMIDPDGREEMTIVFRAFIPQSNVAYIGGGDNRNYSKQADARSRISVTMHIETDPAKNHGNPLMGKPDVHINTTHNNLTGGETPAVVVKTPTVTPSQDANGNVNLNIQMNVHSGDLPAATSIRSDMNIGVNEPGTLGWAHGTVSGSPAFEANFTPLGAVTTNLPIQFASSNALTFTYNC
jgi:RHS repeat-associated protein